MTGGRQCSSHAASTGTDCVHPNFPESPMGRSAGVDHRLAGPQNEKVATHRMQCRLEMSCLDGMSAARRKTNVIVVEREKSLEEHKALAQIIHKRCPLVSVLSHEVDAQRPREDRRKEIDVGLEWRIADFAVDEDNQPNQNVRPGPSSLTGGLDECRLEGFALVDAACQLPYAIFNRAVVEDGQRKVIQRVWLNGLVDKAQTFNCYVNSCRLDRGQALRQQQLLCFIALLDDAQLEDNGELKLKMLTPI